MRLSATAKKITGAIACLAIAAAVGCGGGSQSATTPAAQSQNQMGTAQFAVKFPAPGGASDQNAQRNPKYVSPGANSVTITFGGQSVTIGNQTPGQSQNACTSNSAGARICTVTATIAAGTYTFNATLFDGSNGNGNQLGSGSVQATITPGQTTPVTITFNATIASLNLIVTNGAGTSGCVLVVGQTNACQIIIDTKDIDGFHIMAPGNYINGPITLAASNPAFTFSGPTTITAPGSPTVNVVIQYNGAAVANPQFITATVPGLAASAITGGQLNICVSNCGATPTPVPTASTAASPTPSPAATTPPPSATPTATPTATASASPVPSPTSGGSNFSPFCSQTPLTAGNTYFLLSIEGNVPSGGGTFTATSNTVWGRYPIVAASSTPSAAPTSTSNPTPTPAATARPVNIYYGSYTVSGSAGSAAGCLVALATQNGTPLAHTRAPQSAIRLPLAGGSASIIGFPNLAPGTTIGFQGVTSGTVSSVSLTLNATGSSTGTFTLNDGSTGMLNLSFNSTVQLVPNATPSPSPSPAFGPISVTYNGMPLNGQTLPGPQTVIINVSVPNYTGQINFSIPSCNAPANATFSGSPGTGPNTSFAINTVSAGNTCSYLVTAGSLTASGVFTP